MGLDLPGALAQVFVDAATGAVQVVTGTGATMAAGTVTPGTKAFLDDFGRMTLESPNGEQWQLGAVSTPASVVFRGGGVVNSTPLGGSPTAVPARRWSANFDTNATGLATVVLPPIFSAIWSISASVLSTGATSAPFVGTAVSGSSPNFTLALQVWQGTGVLLGGATLAKPTVPMTVYLEVSGVAAS